MQFSDSGILKFKNSFKTSCVREGWTVQLLIFDTEELSVNWGLIPVKPVSFPLTAHIESRIKTEVRHCLKGLDKSPWRVTCPEQLPWGVYSCSS